MKMACIEGYSITWCTLEYVEFFDVIQRFFFYFCSFVTIDSFINTALRNLLSLFNNGLTILMIT